MQIQPFEKFPADVGTLRTCAAGLLDLAAEAVDLAGVTRTAYAPAIANWAGMGSAELAAAEVPVQRGATTMQEVHAWTSAAGDYWAGQVEAFNRQVDAITAQLGAQAGNDYGATGTGGAPPTEAQVGDARAAATAAARQQWMQAYDTHIDTGAAQTASMLRRGPTKPHLLTLREAGILPVGGPAYLWIGQLLAARAGGSLPTPPAGASPEQNAAWWNSLPPSVQQALIAAIPGALGNLNGLPAWARDRTNRGRLETEMRLLDGERARIQAEIARLQGKLAPHRSAPGFRVAYHDELQRISALQRRDAALRAKQASIKAIEETLKKPGQRQLLLLDLSGERAEAAVAVGDVDSAQHVAVFTPGFTTTVDSSLKGYDEQMDYLQEQAGQLAYDHGQGTVATVTWIGYQAPQWGETLDPSGSVVSQGAADRGAVDLAEFYRGINASRDDDPHVIAIGHSYGSTTTGLAVQQPNTGVDDVVVLGSPGLGTSSVDDLQVPAGHTYVVEARRDYVADFARFGADPNTMEGMTGLSAHEETIEGRELGETTGHDTHSGKDDPKNGYLAPGTASQYNISTVVAGVPDKTIHDHGVGLGDWLW